MTDGVAMQKRDVEPTQWSDGAPEVTMPAPDGRNAAPASAPAVPPTVTPPSAPVDAAPGQDVRRGADATTDTSAPHAAAPTRGAGRWFSALSALIAVAAACAALAAPALRPLLDAEARHWFGAANIVSRLVAPEPAPPPAHAPAELPSDVEAALRAELAGHDQRLLAMSSSLDMVRAELARAAVLPADLDRLNQRVEQLQTAAEVLETRTRAGNVLALAIGLRRDVDAGVPFGANCAALRAIGGFPAPIDAALQQLTRLATGIPTMRDLAEAFEVVQGRLADHTAGPSFSRGWMQVKAVLGLGPQAAENALVVDLRALAMEGRFSEAANLLEKSEWAALGADWIAMVRARAAGVIATQVMLNHALRITEAAYAANGDTTSPKLAQ